MDAIVSHAYPLDVVYDAPWNYAVQRILQYGNARSSFLYKKKSPTLM